MERHLKAYLFDINVAIDEIYSFFELVPKRFDEYQKNLMLRRAVERNIGIIGEATNKVNKEYPSVTISNTRAIVATRNRVIHDYAAVTDDVIWAIVINDLPKLKSEVTDLLNSDEGASCTEKFIASCPRTSDISDEEIQSEVNAVRYGKMKKD